MKTATINLYEFSELAETAKEKAIQEHRDLLESLPQELENEMGSMEDYYGMSYSDEEIIENIEANGYIFFANGELASCVTYFGTHPKAGITEFKFKGNVIEI